MNKMMVGCVAAALVVALVGCKKEETPAEKFKNGAASMWSATKEAAKDAADATADAAKKAADATADAAKKAADAVKD